MIPLRNAIEKRAVNRWDDKALVTMGMKNIIQHAVLENLWSLIDIPIKPYLKKRKNIHPHQTHEKQGLHKNLNPGYKKNK